MTVGTPEQKTVESSEAAPVTSDTRDDELRQQAIASLKRKRRFAQDVVGYVTVNGVLWLIWALTDRTTGGTMPWPAWVSAIWGFFLALDAWKAFGSGPLGPPRPISEADIEREMERSRRA